MVWKSGKPGAPPGGSGRGFRPARRRRHIPKRAIPGVNRMSIHHYYMPEIRLRSRSTPASASWRWGEAIYNDMTSYKIFSDDGYFEQLLDEEESRSHNKLNQHARLTLIRNAKLQTEIVNKIIKQFPDMPGQWIALTVYFIFSHIFIPTRSRPTSTGKRYDSYRGKR